MLDLTQDRKVRFDKIMCLLVALFVAVGVVAFLNTEGIVVMYCMTRDNQLYTISFNSHCTAYKDTKVARSSADDVLIKQARLANDVPHTTCRAPRHDVLHPVLAAVMFLSLALHFRAKYWRQ